jgi:hypothetical protein
MSKQAFEGALVCDIKSEHMYADLYIHNILGVCFPVVVLLGGMGLGLARPS